MSEEWNGINKSYGQLLRTLRARIIYSITMRFHMTPIYFNTRDELIKIDIEKMIYAMADDNYVYLYFRNGQEIMVCMTLQSLEKLIISVISKSKEGGYTRIGRKYIVNNSYIMQINILKQQLILSDLDTVKPITLNVSKEALKVLKQKMINKE